MPARQLRSVKMRWDDKDKTWHKVDQERRPGLTMTPALWAAILVPLLLIGLLAWSLRRGSAAPGASASSASAQECCTVQVQVSGGDGQASISILNTTSTGTWAAGKVIGTVPGPLRLPGEGTYHLNVSAEGFSPAIVEVTVPTEQPLKINLGE